MVRKYVTQCHTFSSSANLSIWSFSIVLLGNFLPDLFCSACKNRTERLIEEYVGSYSISTIHVQQNLWKSTWYGMRMRVYKPFSHTVCRLCTQCRAHFGRTIKWAHFTFKFELLSYKSTWAFYDTKRSIRLFKPDFPSPAADRSPLWVCLPSPLPPWPP